MLAQGNASALGKTPGASDPAERALASPGRTCLRPHACRAPDRHGPHSAGTVTAGATTCPQRACRLLALRTPRARKLRAAPGGVPHGCARALPNTALRRTLPRQPRGPPEPLRPPQPPTFLRVRLLYRRSWHGSDPAGGDHAGCARCPLPAGGEHSWVSARGSDTMGLWRCGLIQRLCPQPPLYLITSERQRIPQPLPLRPETARHTHLPPLAPSTGNPRGRRCTGRPRGWTDARPFPGGRLSGGFGGCGPPPGPGRG